MSYPVPANEAERLRAVEKLRAEAWGASPALDRICAIVSKQLGTPITHFSVVGATEQLLPAKYGALPDRVPRELTFCAHAIMSSSPMVVENAAKDERFADNVFVTGMPGIGAYAGVPLETPAGLCVGTLCTIDLKPRHFSDDEIGLLSDLSEVAMSVIEAHQVKQRLDEELRNSVAMQAKLAESEERFALCIEGASVGLWDWDLRTNALFWSDRFKEIAGILDHPSVSDVSEFERRLHPDDRARIMDRLRRHLQEREPYDVEYRLRHAGGHDVWVHARGQATWDEAGKPIRMAGSADDISIAKRNEQALQESEEKFRSAYHHSPIGMALVSPEGRFLNVNQALCSFLGYDEETLRTLDFQAITPPDDLDQDLDYRRKVLAREIDSFQREKRYLHKDGHVVWALLSASLVCDGDGSPRYFISQIRDITARKAAETEREELIRKLSLSNKELEDFAYVASHDLKAPLRVIDNASSWLEKDLQDTLSEKHRNYLRLLRNRVQRMEKLLDDLLDYARIGRAADDRQAEIVTGRQLVTDILALLSPPPAFRVETAPQLDTIRIARMPLQQVIYNLVNNAIKHHDRGHGTITIGAERCADGLHFSVSDDGPGIPRQYQQQIFDMFRTLKPRDEVEGSGMGLALVKKIVEHMGGHIEVRCGEGRGASFIFTWPDTQELAISGAAA